jgi:uncharacterized cupin superfamily protein
VAERKYLIRADEVAAGDFMGFPTPAVAHHLRNPYDEDLVYLVGGENHDVEIADFPRLGKRMLRLGQNVEVYDVSDARDFGPLRRRPARSRLTPRMHPSLCGPAR